VRLLGAAREALMDSAMVLIIAAVLCVVGLILLEGSR
jgi:hypothetical protein